MSGLTPAVTGKRLQPMKTFQTEAAAKKGERVWLTELAQGTAVDHSKQTVQQYLTAWLDADRCFQELRERAELPDITLHGIRHTAATLLLASGAQLHEVSEMMGHSNPNVTSSIYAHALRERKRFASHALADALSEATRPTD